MLTGDPLALASAVFLAGLIAISVLGPVFVPDSIAGMNLRLRNTPPLSLDHGVLYLLGGDALGRPILPRLLIGARTTLSVAVTVVLSSMAIGAVLGLLAGYFRGFFGNAILRAADVIMSFPSLLLAVIVLYVLEPRVANVVIVIAITRIPVYIRVVRAEVLEIRERLFVEGARAIGASSIRIMMVHIAPMVAPTVFTLAALDFSFVMLAESALSFLGIGVQPPGVTWGLMVADGRDYLATAWWLAFWPGLAIMVTAVAANLLCNWVRIAMDPKLRWRLERIRRTHDLDRPGSAV